MHIADSASNASRRLNSTGQALIFFPSYGSAARNCQHSNILRLNISRALRIREAYSCSAYDIGLSQCCDEVTLSALHDFEAVRCAAATDVDHHLLLVSVLSSKVSLLTCKVQAPLTHSLSRQA